MLVDCSSRVLENIVSGCPWIMGAGDRCSKGVACWEGSLFGVLEGLCFALSAKKMTLAQLEWHHEYWSLRSKIVPSFGGWTPLRTMIFMTRLQKGRHIRATNRLSIFPMVWNMWAQMLIWVPLIKSHKNCVLPIFMKLVLDRGYRLENMINVRVFNMV